jgi:hypothetical protein
MDIEEKRGILLDVGCKNRKQPNWIGIEWKEFPGVDIVHDLESFPYPLPDESCITIKAAHIIEHIQPRCFFPFMDEMWRLLKPDGQIAIGVPYAGSPGFVQDPTHILGLTEKSWQYLDPDCPAYLQYKPKPWKIANGFPVWQVGGNMEIVLVKREEETISKRLARVSIDLGAMQKPSELMGLIDTLKDVEIHTVIEIGTANGGVFFMLCQLASDFATILSIDLPDGKFGPGKPLPPIEKLSGYAKAYQDLHFIRDDSHKEKTLKLTKDIFKDKAEIDLLFIDGDHTYEGVKKDYEMYSPLVKEGGIIIFHDILFHPRNPGCEVERFWNEVKIGKTHSEITDMDISWWGGIGVIWKK